MENGLKVRGYSEGFRVFDDVRLGEVLRYFSGCRMGDNYIQRGVAKPPKEESPFHSYSVEQILNAPHVKEFFCRPDVVAVAEWYLGFTPYIYALNAYRGYPGRKVHGIQKFHRDFDGGLWLVLFVFLSDTTPVDGAHFFVEGSHDLKAWEVVHARSGSAVPFERFQSPGKPEDTQIALANELKGSVVPLCGAAGTGVWVDTWGLHAGGVPKTERFVLWCRYGSERPSIMEKDGVQPISRHSIKGDFDERLLRPLVR